MAISDKPGDNLCQHLNILLPLPSHIDGGLGYEVGLARHHPQQYSLIGTRHCLLKMILQQCI